MKSNKKNRLSIAACSLTLMSAAALGAQEAEEVLQHEAMGSAAEVRSELLAEDQQVSDAGEVVKGNPSCECTPEQMQEQKNKNKQNAKGKNGSMNQKGKEGTCTPGRCQTAPSE
jgi:hypothetical protein